MITERILCIKYSVSKVISKTEAELVPYEANCIYAYATYDFNGRVSKVIPKAQAV